MVRTRQHKALVLGRFSACRLFGLDLAEIFKKGLTDMLRAIVCALAIARGLAWLPAPRRAASRAALAPRMVVGEQATSFGVASLLRKLKAEGRILHWGVSVETVEEGLLAIASTPPTLHQDALPLW